MFRRYIYGILEDGSKEFLHSALDIKGAEAYAKKHAALFQGRFAHYEIWDGAMLTSIKVEVV